MSEAEPIASFRVCDSGAAPEAENARSRAFASERWTGFNRDELQAILNVYGRQVAAGEWRDYALDFGRDTATFSIFRRTAEAPLYRIVKTPKLARRHGLYAVIAEGGLTLRRSPDLAQVLRVLLKRPQLVPV